METFYHLVAILAAGTAMALGLLSLFSFLHKNGQRVDITFTALCMSVVLFILLPPSGFILPDGAPDQGNIKLKRVFNFSFIAIFPWFISLYTGYKKRLAPRIITASVLICYLLMFFTTAESLRTLWVGIAVSILAVTVGHGIYAAYYQYKGGQTAKASWLFAAITSFGFFNILGSFNRIGNNYSAIQWDAVFFPINLCPLAFLLIMGIQLRVNSHKTVQLEKVLGLKETRWQSLLEEIQLVIVHTDIAGRVKYINPFGIKLLGFNKGSELVDTNWSDYCVQVQVSVDSASDIERGMTVNEHATTKRNTLITKDGKQRIIKWTSDLLYDDNGDLVGKMSIGSDITMQEEAIQQIKELKAELEKEAIIAHDESVPTGMHQEVVGKSRPFIYAIQKCKQVARTNASVLLLGETGVGKEAFADLIQATSLRSNQPFVKVNCGALPAELIEDELFGHEKGAFTGAINSRIGRFEKANGGTIFLDEIGELPLVLQPKLLRVLQNGEFERVGGHQTIKVDVRVIAATNSDLEKEVKENRFRDDLFYRLNVFPITIPPLRKRNADIPLLIQYFIERKSKEHGKRFENISKADMSRLCDYEWPGNIRELKNVIERSVISSENHTLKLDWFHEVIERSSQPASTDSLEQMETTYILKVLEECKWKINGENGAAERLVMHPNTLRSRMKKLKISPPWKHDGQVS